MPTVQDALETGYFRGRFARAAASIWAQIASAQIVKALHVPSRIRLVTVGGVTLGGSGKTPVAIALAHRESHRGERVAFIGHAYRARPGRARIVARFDDVHEVGDEALVASRDLLGVAEVVVAPTRQGAIDFAIHRGATCLVVDGVLQTAPRRADLSVLAMDSASTMSTSCPPSGDLRANLDALLAASDFVVEVGDDNAPILANAHRARVVSDGLFAFDGSLVPYDLLARKRIGLALAVAHPERIRARLASHGIEPVAFSYVGDHLGDRLRSAMQRVSLDHTDIDAWITTTKCATFVRPQPGDAPAIYVVAHRVELSGALP